MKHYSLIIALLLIPTNVFAIDCIYAPKPTTKQPFSDIAPQGACGKLSGDLLKLRNDHFDNLSFSQDGLATILISNPKPIKAFYVSKLGKIVRAHFYDNGADSFQEGLARTISKNKFGYINTMLEVVIPAKYDHAFPFQDGHAIVCIACTTEYFDKHREHKNVVGGKWGVINKNGEDVIPINFTREELLSQTELKKIFTQPPLLME